MADNILRHGIEIDLTEALFCETLHRQRAAHIADTTWRLGECAMRFADVERVPRYDETSRENDAGHSYMLALVAPEIAAQHFPDLDTGLVAQFCIVHDLIELETNDVATFTLSEAEVAAKESAEQSALDCLAATLPPHTAALLLRYEKQVEAEARFVRLVDKLLPVVVDTLGPGRKVMAEDYAVHSPAQLAAVEAKLSTRLKNMFPEPEARALHAARTILANRFATIFAAAAINPTESDASA